MPNLIKPLVEKKMDINKQDKRGWSALAYAVRNFLEDYNEFSGNERR